MRPIPRALFWNELRVELGWPWTAHADTRGRVLNPDDAVLRLRSFRRTPAAMEHLRAAFGDELSGYRVARLSDDKLIDQLAWRVRTGWIKVSETHFATITPRVRVEETATPALPAPPPPVVRAAPPAVIPLAVVASNPDCTIAFHNAAANATPLVERGGANCS